MPPSLALSPVLVVEDDAHDMFLFTRLLKAAGAVNALHIALDGREAIRLLTPIVEKNRLVAKPALAFVDVRMPHFSGLEVLAWIREQRELDDLAVAMMSASPERAEIERAATLGAQCFLTKFPRTLAISRLLEGAARFNGQDGLNHFDLPDNLLRQLPRQMGEDLLSPLSALCDHNHRRNPRMPAPLKFLVIDDNADSRFLLVKTLLRKFPTAIIHECQSSEAAFEMAKTEDLAAIISHRTTETAGITLLRDIRTINPDVPMVMVSGIDRTELAIAAGADRFLLYDEWLRIGTLVEELVAARTHNSRPPGPRF